METKRGVMIASVAAALVLSGAVVAHAQAGSNGDVHCYGVNECRGQGACKGKNHCEGKNDCKAKGVMRLSPADCMDKGGTIVPEDDPDEDQ